jgi:formate hydrogenlyase transcriptional activator
MAIHSMKSSAPESDLERLTQQLRQANQALSDSEERFRDLFEEAPIAYVHEGVDTRLIRANRAALKILGMKSQDIVGTFGKSLA